MSAIGILLKSDTQYVLMTQLRETPLTGIFLSRKKEMGTPLMLASSHTLQGKGWLPKALRTFFSQKMNREGKHRQARGRTGKEVYNYVLCKQSYSVSRIVLKTGFCEKKS